MSWLRNLKNKEYPWWRIDTIFSNLKLRNLEIINDGEYHTYTIDWHAGGDGEVPRVIWLIDGEEVYRHEGNEFGQDNIPYRASRFWLGIWFPAAGFKERIEGETVPRVGWAGDTDFDQGIIGIFVTTFLRRLSLSLLFL